MKDHLYELNTQEYISRNFYLKLKRLIEIVVHQISCIFFFSKHVCLYLTINPRHTHDIADRVAVIHIVLSNL